MMVMINTSGNRRKRPSKFKILNHLEPYLYSEWSRWSPCLQSCYTKRTRTCKFLEICGEKEVKEDYKPCYKEGDQCEKKYLERLDSLTPNETLSHLSDDGTNPFENMTCGVPEISAGRRISGGKKAIKGVWPWQVLILSEHFEPFCGGILLSSQWVLTAAHCVRRRLYVRAGEFDLSYLEGSEQQERVSQIFVYPEYDPTTVDNDIVLLKMRTPFEMTDYVLPICLPNENEELPLYSRATILGWGKRRNVSSYGTDILHQAEVPTVPLDECRKAYKKYWISDNMLCAGFESGHVDSCRGDSGGPLMHRRKDGTWAVYGITSFGDGCGQKMKYGVYASVVNHLPWIKSIIKHTEQLERKKTEENEEATEEATEETTEEATEEAR